jgi:hypothetical protein
MWMNQSLAKALHSGSPIWGTKRTAALVFVCWLAVAVVMVAGQLGRGLDLRHLLKAAGLPGYFGLEISFLSAVLVAVVGAKRRLRPEVSLAVLALLPVPVVWIGLGGVFGTVEAVEASVESSHDLWVRVSLLTKSIDELLCMGILCSGVSVALLAALATVLGVRARLRPAAFPGSVWLIALIVGAATAVLVAVVAVLGGVPRAQISLISQQYRSLKNFASWGIDNRHTL